MPASAELQPGDLFAGHRIESIAGRGGMGVVYRATQLDLDRTVALKLIAGALAQDQAFRDRFITETRVAASIDHPNVIPVYYAGDIDDRLYIAMRYVEGDDLRTLVRREGRLEAPRAAHIVAQVGAALDAAHARGIVHRDVKPANVLLGERDHAYLTDFGLTKRVQSATGATKAGGWVGTLGYVSPEQIRGGRVDARSDVYALGCLLFHALTGTTPYQRDSDEATLWAHLHDPPPDLSARVPDVPAGFEDVITRALAKDPDERYQSTGDLGRAALAAAGRPDARAPERIVATGAAAPPIDEETIASPSRRATVQAAGGPAAAAAAPAGRHRPAGALVAIAVVSALVVAGIVALLLLAGGGEPAPKARTTASAPKPRPGPVVAGKVVAKIPAGGRPNAVAATARRVFVASGSSQRIAVVSTKDNTLAHSRPRVGVGAAALTAGFGSVWIAKGNTQTVLRYKLSDGTRQGAPVLLPPGTAAAIAVGQGSVWVGSRSGRGRAVPQTVARIDPGTNTVSRSVVAPRGVQNLAVGEGAVWVIDRSRRGLTRIDVATGATRPISTGRDAYAVAVGDGKVWVTNEGDDTVSEISAHTYKVRRRIPVGNAPKGVDVGGGAVWVANNLDGTLTRIDAGNGKVVGKPVDLGANSNPFAVSVHGSSAWVTLLAENAVARVDFAPAR